MTETPRETRVLGAVVSLVDSLLVDFDVVELLTELTERCAQLLDVDGRLHARLPVAGARGRRSPRLAPASRHPRRRDQSLSRAVGREAGSAAV